ncbi:hypothetical protein SBA3_1960023 [Candidatus Sulfopaludibacter sp. SbA3]|nr:hypothetical protein SBA3_1960023 [Candidatus Sulfopaludibacter sp. SbA3]
MLAGSNLGFYRPLNSKSAHYEATP